MRRSILLGLVLSLALPGTVLAGAWHTYADRMLGFSVRYPGSWQASVTIIAGEHTVVLSSQGRYSVQISVLPIAPGKNAADMARRVQRYQLRRGVTTFVHMHWHASSLSGRFADVAVVGQQTEGGVAVSQAFWLAPGKGRTYQIMIPVNAKHVVHSFDAFPAVYRQILSTWRYR